MAKKKTSEGMTCTEIDKILDTRSDVEELKRDLRGYNGDEGLIKTVIRIDNNVNGILNKQKSASKRTLAILLTVIPTSLAVIFFLGIAYFKINTVYEDYVPKSVLNGYLKEFTAMTSAIQKMAASKTIEEMKEYQKEYEMHSHLFDYMDKTRSIKSEPLKR